MDDAKQARLTAEQGDMRERVERAAREVAEMCIDFNSSDGLRAAFRNILDAGRSESGTLAELSGLFTPLIAAAIKSAKSATREADCKAACWRCRDGEVPELTLNGTWSHSSGVWDEPCAASAIRALGEK